MRGRDINRHSVRTGGELRPGRCLCRDSDVVHCRLEVAREQGENRIVPVFKFKFKVAVRCIRLVGVVARRECEIMECEG